MATSTATHPTTTAGAPAPTADAAPGRSAARSGAVATTLLSISCVQVSDALNVPLIASVGPAGSAWLRVSLGALLLVATVRPDVRSLGPAQWGSVTCLGVLCAGLSASFMSALALLPLGTAVALEFLGPLAVAVARGRGRGARWPLTALAGVLVLTAPWQGTVPLRGVAYALLAAACWGGTIVLTTRVGAQVPGVTGVALALPVAALCLAPWAAFRVVPALGPGTLVLGLGLAVLMPVLPHLLELRALRQLPEATFATLMSFEPVLAVAVGAVVLGQRPSVLSALGILLVVAAGVGVTRSHPPAPLPERQRHGPEPR